MYTDADSPYKSAGPSLLGSAPKNDCQYPLRRSLNLVTTTPDAKLKPTTSTKSPTPSHQRTMKCFILTPNAHYVNPDFVQSIALSYRSLDEQIFVDIDDDIDVDDIFAAADIHDDHDAFGPSPVTGTDDLYPLRIAPNRASNNHDTPSTFVSPAAIRPSDRIALFHSDSPLLLTNDNDDGDTDYYAALGPGFGLLSSPSICSVSSSNISSISPSTRLTILSSLDATDNITTNAPPTRNTTPTATRPRNIYTNFLRYSSHHTVTLEHDYCSPTKTVGRRRTAVATPSSAVSSALSASPSAPSPSSARYDSSLGLLTRKFVQLLTDAASQPSQSDVPGPGGGLLDLNVAAATLQVQKRRIYDITNVLEGIGLIEKKNKNQVCWKANRPDSSSNVSGGLDNDSKVDTDASKIGSPPKITRHSGQSGSPAGPAAAALQREIDSLVEHERYLDSLIEAATTMSRKQTTAGSQKGGKSSLKGGSLPHLYVQKDEITSLQDYANDTVIAIKAPSGTTLEVPDPDKGMSPGRRRFQIYLQSPDSSSGPINVYLVQYKSKDGGSKGGPVRQPGAKGDSSKTSAGKQQKAAVSVQEANHPASQHHFAPPQDEPKYPVQEQRKPKGSAGGKSSTKEKSGSAVAAKQKSHKSHRPPPNADDMSHNYPYYQGYHPGPPPSHTALVERSSALSAPSIHPRRREPPSATDVFGSPPRNAPVPPSTGAKRKEMDASGGLTEVELLQRGSNKEPRRNPTPPLGGVSDSYYASVFPNVPDTPHGQQYGPGMEYNDSLINAPIQSPTGGFGLHPATPKSGPLPGGPPGRAQPYGYSLSPKTGNMGDILSFPPTPSSSLWASQAAAAEGPEQNKEEQRGSSGGPPHDYMAGDYNLYR